MFDRSAARGVQSEEGVFSFRNICRAYLDCRRSKRSSVNALKFEMNSLDDLLRLEKELQSRSYHPSHSVLFAARKPKLREIFAADFRDRIVHHILVRYLTPLWEPSFIYDSYANRIDKGTHRAIRRLQRFLRKATSNGHTRAYFLQLDIKDFFTSIDKEILFGLLKKKITDPDILWLTELIIFWDCTKSYVLQGDKDILTNVPANKSLFGKDNKRGLPIGNLSSQFFANVYMNELDQYIKHTLKVRYYVRYVDDFVLVSRDRAELAVWKAKIGQFLADRLKLTLHPRRQKLQPVSNGIDFLGYVIRPNYILVRRRVVNNLKAKLKAFRGSGEKFRAMVASYLGHFKWANSYRLTHKLITARY
jgi:hypothetical protein